MADLNQMAYRVVQHATEPQEPETPAQVNGRSGGRKGGRARTAKPTGELQAQIVKVRGRGSKRRGPGPDG